MSLQEAGCKEVGGVEGAELVQYSRYYRSALHECVIALKKKAEGEGERERERLVVLLLTSSSTCPPDGKCSLSLVNHSLLVNTV